MTTEETLALAARLLSISSSVLILDGPAHPMPTVHISRRVIYLEDALKILGVEEDEDEPGTIVPTEPETVYISGPMTGMHNLNREAFAEAARMLQAKGYRTINPHDLSPERITGETDDEYYERCLEVDLEAIKTANKLFQLPSWGMSLGALREFKQANELGIGILRA